MYGSDSEVAARTYAAWDFWQLGYPDRGRARAQEAVAFSRTLAEPFSLTLALVWEAGVHWLRRDGRAQRERAAEVIALSEAQGFPLWLGTGRAFHGAARAALSGGAEAVAEVMEGLALGAGTGSQAGAPGLLALLAEVHTAACQHAEAFGAVETALAISAQTGQHFFDAELHHLKGALLLASEVGREAEAEGLFRHALEIARAQEARSFELRAATSLGRLLRAQGKPVEARALLAPVYSWFTEGFDTRDLVEAKALLEELA